ncbi:hypothetical protein [Cupriavidus taiwanensis]|uniref:hypothetical protein n=1 Tax=Cupriavidus taiwanensis TaxID=164546 RepID=UPI000E132A72|nr:hypothetical protein [Cupriavidus taiwanensis]SOY70904.1 conserved hypothetical protein [Cupriavidus taiwanensis]
MQNFAVLILPGTWSSLSEFKSAVKKHAPNYRFANGVLVDQRTRQSVRVHFHMGHLSSIVEDFRYGGIYWDDSDDMRAIAGHTSHVLLADAGGSLQRMAHVMGAASAVVRSGALGVYVENAGVAHPSKNWLALANDGIDGVFRAFVVTVDAGASGAHCSGLQNFGLKDVSVPSTVPDCTTVAGAFAWHLVVKEVKVKAGESMMVGTKSSRSRVRIVESAVVPEGSMFDNRFGTWQLLPATSVH